MLTVPFIIATLLALHGWRKKSLSPDGAAAAFFVGFLMLAAPLRAFGVSLIVFYLAGSRATKCERVRCHCPYNQFKITSDGKSLKSVLEDGFHEAGYRSAWQVLCNSFAAFIATVIWSALFAPGSIPWVVASKWNLGGADAVSYASGGWCPLSPQISGGASRALVFAALGSVP